MARIAVTAARLFLGLAFFVFGLNGFLHFLPQPPPPASAAQFLQALLGAGYMFPLIKGTEVLVGVLLLSNRFVPLALTLLAPVMVNIVAFHLFLEPIATVALPGVLLAVHLVLAWAYRSHFAGVLAARALPTSATSARETSRPAVGGSLPGAA